MEQANKNLPIKVALTTFGCRANQYDTAVIENRLQTKNFVLVDFDSRADVYVVNSCAITDNADNEARRLISRAKRNNPQATTIVTGCSAQVNPDVFKKGSGAADFILANQDKDALIKLIESKTQAFENHTPEKIWPITFEGGQTLSNHSRAFLKIQDGCSQFCSFCIVPFSRGLNRSVDPDQILQALYQLKEKGLNEVVLTGIHLGTYGKDLKDGWSLNRLLQTIDDKKPIPRVRLSSIDPEEVDDELIELLAGSKTFCNHLHLPVQSGDDVILSKMKRRYDSRLFYDLAEKLHQKIPDLCLGTDIIVGFPGEGEGEFANTVNLVENTGLSYAHVFPYSERKGTKAANFEEKVPVRIRKERSQILRKISSRLREIYDRKFVGREFEVVIEKRGDKMAGMTPNYLSVELDVPPQIVERGSLARVKILSFNNGLQGSLVGSKAFSSSQKGFEFAV